MMKKVTEKKAELLSRHMSEIFCILHSVGWNQCEQKLVLNGKTIIMTFKIAKDEGKS